MVDWPRGRNHDHFAILDALAFKLGDLLHRSGGTVMLHRERPYSNFYSCAWHQQRAQLPLQS